MAESGEGQEDDILKCPICLEILNKPKYLPCLHTFCEHCLKSYIITTVKESAGIGAETKVDVAEKVEMKVDVRENANLDDGNEAKTKVKDDTEGKIKEMGGSNVKTRVNDGIKAEFNCPFCRVVVPAPDSQLAVEEWASQFPNNHLIMTLLDKQKLQTKAKMCDPCQVDGDDVIAISWCKVCNEALCGICAKYHRKMLATKQHKLFLIADQENDFQITRLEFCENHKDKQLEAFCFDHDQACCVSCISIDHRKCDKVTSLADAAKDVLNNPEHAQLCERLVETEKVLTAILNISKENLSDIHSKKASMLMEISELQEKINRHFADIAANLVQEIKDEEKQITTIINDLMFDVENRQKRVSSYRKVYDATVDKATNIHVFLEIKKLENKQNEMEEYLKQSLMTINRIDCSLDIAPEIKEHILHIERFGSMNVQRKNIKKEVSLRVHHVPNLSRRIRLGDELTLYRNFDVPVTNIYYCVFLPNGNLAITSGVNQVRFCEDNGNDMKLFDIGEGPTFHGLDVLNDNEILVSRPNADLINKLNFHKRISTKKFEPKAKCKGLAVLDSCVVMACKSKLVFMDHNGAVTRSINVKPPVDNVTSFNQNIYYTNSENNNMIGITFNGNSIFEYTHPDLQKPLGLTTDENGNIYVAGRGSSNVHQVSPEGSHIRMALTEKDGILNPHALCFDKKNKKLLVSHSKNKISIFERTW